RRCRRRARRWSRLAGDPVFWVEPRGYVGPSHLREVLARAAEFGARHPGGWDYVVDTSRVTIVNPLNPIWLRRIKRLPNLRRYVVIAPSRFARFMMRLSSWIVRPDRIVASRDELDA